MKVSFVPLGKRVLVKRDDSHNTTASGIYVGNDLIANKGTVAAVGNIDKTLYSIKNKDRVMLPNSKGIEILEGEVIYELFEIEQILGILNTK